MDFSACIHWEMDGFGNISGQNPFAVGDQGGSGLNWLETLPAEESRFFLSMVSDTQRFPISFSMEFHPGTISPGGKVFHGKFVRQIKGGEFSLLCHALEIERESLSVSSLMPRLKSTEEATREKSSFLANMSHEIRTPIQSVLGYAHILADQELDVEERQKMSRAMARSGEFLLQLVKDILDFSKIEAGKLDIDQQACSPWYTTVSVVETLGIQADAKNIKLQVVPKGPIPTLIHTDITKVRQILVNLIGNAIKFTPKGKVEIHLNLIKNHERECNYLVFDVADQGPGMTPSQINDLFKPFTRVGRGALSRVEGTGLGLTIANRLARLLNGFIKVVSLEKAGSVFSFYLPVLDADLGRMLEPQSLAMPHGKSSANITSTLALPTSASILLAEDNEDIQVYLKYLLEKEGLEVTVVSNGLQVINELEQADYDLILMDLQMPVQDGKETTQKLRAMGCTIPIVALTANATSEDELHCNQLGFNSFLTKPVDRERLLEVLASHLPLGRDPDKTAFVREKEIIPREMAAGFVHSVLKKIPGLGHYLEKGEYELLQKEAHQIRGAGGLYDYFNITRIAGDLEDSIRMSEEKEKLVKFIEELKHELEFILLKENF